MARKTSWRSTRKQPKSATKNPRLTRASGGERTVPRKLADADGQIQALRHLAAEPGVSIASSIDTIRPRWCRRRFANDGFWNRARPRSP